MFIYIGDSTRQYTGLHLRVAGRWALTITRRSMNRPRLRSQRRCAVQPRSQYIGLYTRETRRCYAYRTRAKGSRGPRGKPALSYCQRKKVGYRYQRQIAGNCQPFICKSTHSPICVADSRITLDFSNIQWWGLFAPAALLAVTNIILTFTAKDLRNRIFEIMKFCWIFPSIHKNGCNFFSVAIWSLSHPSFSSFSNYLQIDRPNFHLFEFFRCWWISESGQSKFQIFKSGNNSDLVDGRPRNGHPSRFLTAKDFVE